MERGELHSIEGLSMTELEKHDGKIHYYSTVEAGEFLELWGCLKPDGSDIEPSKWPDVIMLLSRDENGKRLFPAAHRDKILKWDAVDFMKVVRGLKPALDAIGDQLLGKS